MKRFIWITGILCLVVFVIVGFAFCRNQTSPQPETTGESDSPNTDGVIIAPGENDNATVDADAFLEPEDTTAATAPAQQGQYTPPQTTPVRPDEPAGPSVTTPVRPDEPATQATVPTTPPSSVPDTTEPQTTIPETTVPETTVPETTVPETTVPAIEEDGYNSQIVRP